MSCAVRINVYTVNTEYIFVLFIFLELKGRMAETQTLNFGPEW